MDILKFIATIKEVHSVSPEILNGVSKLQLSQKQKEQKEAYTTTKSSKPDCSVKKDSPSSSPLSLNETCGMYSSLRPQSRSALYDVVPDDDKWYGPHISPFRRLPIVHSHLESLVYVYRQWRTLTVSGGNGVLWLSFLPLQGKTKVQVQPPWVGLRRKFRGRSG